jgi:hypothetical protein
MTTMWAIDTGTILITPPPIIPAKTQDIRRKRLSQHKKAKSSERKRLLVRRISFFLPPIVTTKVGEGDSISSSICGLLNVAMPASAAI